MDLIFNMFLLILNASLHASVVAILLVILKKTFNNRISPRLHYILWFFLLIRLLVPILPESTISIFNVFEEKPVLISAYETYNFATGIDIDNSIKNDDLKHLNLINITDENSTESSSYTFIILKYMSLIWFIGFVFMILLLIQSLLRIKLKTRYFEMIENKNILDTVMRCKDALKITKEIKIYTGDYFMSPCILGVINPYIYYPRDMIEKTSDYSLHHVIMHELAHYKRKDNISNLIRALAISIHWFNPIIWLCVDKMHRDIELACDSYVLEVLGENEVISYGKTIIECLKLFSSNKLQPNVLFFGQSNQYERRIRMIKNFKKGSYKLSIATLIFTLAMGVVIGTNSITTDANINDSIKDISISGDTPNSTMSIFNDKVIMIDPSHGGIDRGAINGELGLEEKAIALDVSIKLKSLLEDQGFRVYMTREDDTYIKLKDRVTQANELNADIFISLHIGASSDKTAQGITSLYANVDDRDNKGLAIILNKAIATKINSPMQHIVESSKLVSLRDTKMPAVSLELGYLTNIADGQQMLESDYSKKCAEGITQGIINYFNTN